MLDDMASGLRRHDDSRHPLSDAQRKEVRIASGISECAGTNARRHGSDRRPAARAPHERVNASDWTRAKSSSPLMPRKLVSPSILATLSPRLPRPF